MESAFTGALYCGPAPLPTEISMRWNFDPLFVLALVVLALLT